MISALLSALGLMVILLATACLIGTLIDTWLARRRPHPRDFYRHLPPVPSHRAVRVERDDEDDAL